MTADNNFALRVQRKKMVDFSAVFVHETVSDLDFYGRQYHAEALTTH